MYNLTIKCYQTCKTESKVWRELFDSFPHFAINNCAEGKLQWLGEGYYFWTDSVKNAEWWGNNRLKVPYCITGYSVDLNSEILFDLTGNAEHIEYFYDLRKTFIDIHKKFSKSKIFVEPTVDVMIDYFRRNYKENIFKFEAIKFHHNNYDPDYQKVNMTSGRPEFFQGLPRIQLCVFPERKSDITNKLPYYPEAYCNSVSS